MKQSDDAEVFRVAVTMFRALKGWSQAELAAATGLGASAISRYESGAQVPTAQTLARIRAAAGVPPMLAPGLLSWIRAAQSAMAGGTVNDYADDVIEAAAAELGQALSQLMRTALEEIREDYANESDDEPWEDGPPFR
jgi:transcriptional regulator with XRE-family HTH domain